MAVSPAPCHGVQQINLARSPDLDARPLAFQLTDVIADLHNLVVGVFARQKQRLAMASSKSPIVAVYHARPAARSWGR